MVKGLGRQTLEHGGHRIGLADRRLYQHSYCRHSRHCYLALLVGNHCCTHRLCSDADHCLSARRVQFGLPDRKRTAPLLVAVSAPLLVSEHLDGPGFFAVTLIVIGVFLIGAFGNERILDGRRAILLSLATGVLIATYTMIDGQRARAGSTPHAYAGWLFFLNGIPVILLAKRRLDKNVKSLFIDHWQKGVPIGVLSALAYWVIVWAMTVAPIALVASVRETSILFAALTSWGVLGEKVRPLRWAGVVITLVGLVLAKF